ncbi:ABC transporter ATP-binding protein [Nocardioides alkalitolerans]|uniref:ABC transporter ATP-binding protein n=1 Tax=Nocardioides alkalitolerans TaxID=281714 RepID=UPI00040245C8|nr:ABC transporter ATP-binding protein [Nocardioides alkalitolerans]
MADEILTVSGLSVGYGDIGVLQDVGIRAWSGRVTAIFGANGAGKTTLMSAIAGLIPARSGSVVLAGRDLVAASANRRFVAGISLVQEGKRVFHQRTVEENLRLGGYRMGRRERAAGLDGAYDRFPVLADRRAARAGSLSGGQQQMLAIAQALVSQPKVLLLDEPSAGLAPIIVAELLGTISTLSSEGMAVVLVEQLVGQAMTVADHVIALQQGRVVIDSPAAGVDGDQLHAAYLGEQDHTVV